MVQINAVTAYEVHDGIAVITTNNPPVNALGHAVRAGLVEALAAAMAEPAAQAIVLACDGRTFFAGADITEFGKPPEAPDLGAVIAALDASTKPVVAGIFGTALGGGLEVALGCHYRVATATARLGLPEVKLGLLPGAGGTQRLPRLIGPEQAVSMICSGAPVTAKAALAAGLIDVIMEDALFGAIAFARQVLATGGKFTRVRDLQDKINATRDDPAAFEAAAKTALKKLSGVEAPAACVESVRSAFLLPFDEGLAQERQKFMTLVSGAQSRAQRHIFFAEREASKIPGTLPGRKAPPIKTAAVIGGGTMGGGIAMCFANVGVPVTIVETTVELLTAGLARIESTYQTSVQRGTLGAEVAEKRLALISGATDFPAIGDADIVIEAVFENLDLKKEVFAKLDSFGKSGVLLASNTSTLDVDAIGDATTRPTDVVGMHFFSPANVMKLLEIVRTEKSSTESIIAAVAAAKLLKKIPVVVGNCDGFVGNRMLASRSIECERLLLEGAAPADVDAIVQKFGFPMGPFAMADLAGLDVGWRIRKHRGVTAPVSDALCEMGRFGQKTGAGFYAYENGARTPMPDPSVLALATEKAAAHSIAQRPDISAQEILERMTYPMINEAARILEEGIAIRASDIDVIWVYGYGFPAWRGGPCFYADEIGLRPICEALNRYADLIGDEKLRPADLLQKLAQTGATFGSFKGA